MKRIYARKSIILGLTVLLFCLPSRADLGGMLLGDEIEDIQRTIAQLTANANTTGDALASRAANELSVALQNTLLIVGDQLDKKVDDLRGENLRIVTRLDEMNDRVKKLTDAAYELQATTSLTMRDLVGELPLTLKTNFYVGSIKGITQLQNDMGYSITILGIGFGPDSDKRRSNITSVTVDGEDIKGYDQQRVKDYTTDLRLPATAFSFKSKTPTFSIVKLVVSVESKGGLFPHWQKQKFPLSFTVCLMPDYAGSITVTYTKQIKDWATIEDRHEYNFTTIDHDQSGGDIKSYSYTWFKDLPNNMRFVYPIGYRLGDQNNYWGWSSLAPDNRNRGKMEIVENGHRLLLAYNVWGKAFFVYPYACIQEYKVVRNEQVSIQRDLFYGKDVTVPVPTELAGWLVSGQTITRTSISCANNRSSGLLRFREQVPGGDEKTLVWSVDYPAGFTPGAMGSSANKPLFERITNSLGSIFGASKN